MSAKNAVEALLQYDPAKITTLKKDHLMRLKKLGTEMVFPLESLSTENVCKIQDEAIRMYSADKSNESIAFENMVYETKVKTIILGCPAVFTNPQILKHFNVKKSRDLINELLTPAEVDELKNAIDELSGYETEELPTTSKTADEVKN